MNKVKKIIGLNEIHKKGILGEGIGVAVLDTGISGHPDFDNRIYGFYDSVNLKKNFYDDEGHGTHVTGIIAGAGKIENTMCGVAPKCHIVSIKVLDKTGSGNKENVLKGLYWIIDNGKKYNIKIVNISFGTIKKDENKKNKLLRTVELLWDLGYIVVAAAGNNGPDKSTISTPGDSKKIITVGSMENDMRIFVNGKITKNYSGRGPTFECVQKPDVVAPGNHIFSCGNLWMHNNFYVSKSGTSMATPIVSGIMALILSQNNKISNVQCKKMLKKTSIDLNMEKNTQGWGLINPKALLEQV